MHYPSKTWTALACVLLFMATSHQSLAYVQVTCDQGNFFCNPANSGQTPEVTANPDNPDPPDPSDCPCNGDGSPGSYVQSGDPTYSWSGDASGSGPTADITNINSNGGAVSAVVTVTYMWACDSDQSVTTTTQDTGEGDFDADSLISFSQSSVELCEGQTGRDFASGGNGTLNYATDDPYVATNSDGNIYAQESGTTTFMATDDIGCTATSTIIVTDPEISGPNSVMVKQSITLTYSDGFNNSSDVTWQSDNPAVASVDNSGVVTGNTAGVVTITAKSNTSDCSATQDVTVTCPIFTVGITPSQDQTVKVGSSVSFDCMPQGGVPPYTYQWTFQNGTPPTFSSKTPDRVVFGSGALGQKNLCKVIITDKNNCIATNSINVIVPMIRQTRTDLSLWFAAGTTAGSDIGVDDWQKMTLEAVPPQPAQGNYQWKIASGSDKIVIVPSNSTATLTSTAPSVDVGDVEIDLLDSNSKVVAQFYETVYTPVTGNALSNNYTAYIITTYLGVEYKGWGNVYKTEFIDQFGNQIGGSLYVNEQYGSATALNPIETWSLGGIVTRNGQINPDNTWPDLYGSPGIAEGPDGETIVAATGVFLSVKLPYAVWETDTNASAGVFNIPQTYRAGSLTSGVGAVMNSHTGVQWDLGYAYQY